VHRTPRRRRARLVWGAAGIAAARRWSAGPGRA
jgi:hypothetical protein